MELIRNSNENEMILEFLKGEINSKRFSSKLYSILKSLNISSDIINNGDISNDNENKIRLNIIINNHKTQGRILFFGLGERLLLFP